MNLFILRIRFKTKDLKVKEFLSNYGLKFIKWNANTTKMPEVFYN